MAWKIFIQVLLVDVITHALIKVAQFDLQYLSIFCCHDILVEEKDEKWYLRMAPQEEKSIGIYAEARRA